jgi:hypothetical protein
VKPTPRVGENTASLAARTVGSTSSFQFQAGRASAPIPSGSSPRAGRPVSKVLLVLLAAKKKIALPPDLAIDAEVDLHLADTGYFLSARFNISLPSIARDIAQKLVEEAEQLCPYSKATRGDIDAVFNLVENLNPLSLNEIVVALKNEIPARP